MGEQFWRDQHGNAQRWSHPQENVVFQVYCPAPCRQQTLSQKCCWLPALPESRSCQLDVAKASTKSSKKGHSRAKTDIRFASCWWFLFLLMATLSQHVSSSHRRLFCSCDFSQCPPPFLACLHLVCPWCWVYYRSHEAVLKKSLPTQYQRSLLQLHCRLTRCRSTVFQEDQIMMQK